MKYERRYRNDRRMYEVEAVSEAGGGRWPVCFTESKRRADEIISLYHNKSQADLIKRMSRRCPLPIINSDEHPDRQSLHASNKEYIENTLHSPRDDE